MLNWHIAKMSGTNKYFSVKTKKDELPNCQMKILVFKAPRALWFHNLVLPFKPPETGLGVSSVNLTSKNYLLADFQPE